MQVTTIGSATIVDKSLQGLDLKLINLIKQYAQEWYDSSESFERDFLKQLSFGSLSLLHLTLGMSIRNHYKLWEAGNPLTAAYHEEGYVRDIRDGVDYSIHHPDHISSLIIQEIWKLCQQ